MISHPTLSSSNNCERDSSILSFSHLFVALDDENSNRDNNDDDDDYIVDDDYISADPKVVFSVSSFRSIWRSESNLSFSKLSSSDNTDRMSNMRRAEDNNRSSSRCRDCGSPPSCIDGGDFLNDGNAPRSIFGMGTKKKYNVRRKDVDSKWTPSQRHMWTVHLQEELSIDTGIFSSIDVEYSPRMNQNDEMSSGPYDPSRPPLLTERENFFSHAHKNDELSPLTPLQAHIGGGRSNDRKPWMKIIENFTAMKRYANTTQQNSNPITDGNGPLLRPIFALALPSAVQSILSNAYGLNSFVFVGHMRDRERSSIATTALSSVVGIQIVIFAFHNVIPSGANTHVSQYAGAGNCVMVGHCFQSAFYSSVAFGSIVGIVGWLSIVGISEMCNSDDPRVTAAIREYLSIVFLASPFFSIMLLVDGYYKSIGDASTSFKLELMSLVLNTLLNYVMVVRFDYGIGGSAIAASTARLVPALCGLYWILRGEYLSLSLLQDPPPRRRLADVERLAEAAGGWRAVELASQWAGTTMADRLERDVSTYGSVSCVTRNRVRWRDDDDYEDKVEVDNEDKRHIICYAGPYCTIRSNLCHALATSLRMARIGVFDSIAACIYGACFTSLVRICGLLGDKEQAGLGAGLRGVEWLAFCLSEGFLVAAATSVGQCIGANAQERAMDVAIVCCALSALTAGLLGVPFILFSNEISWALISDDEEIVKYCAQYVHVIGWVMSLVGFEMACYGSLLGAGRANIACCVNGACNILRIPLAIYCLYSSRPVIEMAHLSLWAFGISGMENFPQPTGDFYCIGGVIAFTASIKAVIWFGYFLSLWISGKYFRGTSIVGVGKQQGSLFSRDYTLMDLEEK